MNVVLELLQKAWSENLVIVMVNLIVSFGLYFTNIFFGTIIGTKTMGFNLKKFLFGILKALGCCSGIFLFCYLLNLFSLGMNLTNLITVKAEVTSTIEVIAVLYIWIIDLSKEVLDKIKSMKDLKYVTYDDVEVQQNPEPSGGIG